VTLKTKIMQKDYDVIIIGAGPSGLTSSIFTSRYGLKTALFEKLMPGGQIALTDRIENYPGFRGGISGVELARNFKEHAKEHDIDFISEEVLSIAVNDSKIEVESRKTKFKALTLIISTGARPKRLSIPGEEELTGKGVSYCATCDGPFYKEKDVIVIGGGNTAVEEALYLSEIAASLKLIHRRDRLRAMEIYQEKLKAKNNVELLLNTVAFQIIGKDKVEAIKVKQTDSDEKKELPCDGIFIFAGYVPNSDFFKSLINHDSKGYIITNSNMKTSHKGIFATGDVRSKSLKQIVTACSDGAIAADSAFRYISKLKNNLYPGWEE